MSLEFYQHLVSIIFLSVITWAIITCAYRRGYFQRKEHKYPELLNLQDAIQLFSIFIFTQFILIPIILHSLISYQNSGMLENTEFMGWLNLITIGFAAVILGIFFFNKWDKMKYLFFSNRPLYDIGFGVMSWFIAFPTALLCSLIIVFVLTDLLGFSLTDQSAVKQMKNALSYPFLFFFSMTIVAFVVPMLEEIIFRGYLQTALKKHMGTFKAIFFSSILFALFHFSVNQGVNNFNIVFTLFVLSLFLGFTRERQGNLLPSIALHSTFNAISILMILIQD